MTNYSYGPKQYIAVQGRDKAFALAADIMKARDNDCQVMVQYDDCDIYIVSWANRYGPNDGEAFVFMDEDDQEKWDNLKYTEQHKSNDDGESNDSVQFDI